MLDMSLVPTSPPEHATLGTLIESMTADSSAGEENIEVLETQGAQDDGDSEQDDDDEGDVITFNNKEIVVDKQDLLLLAHAEAAMDTLPQGKEELVRVSLIACTHL